MFGSPETPIIFDASLNFGGLILSQFQRYSLGVYIHRYSEPLGVFCALDEVSSLFQQSLVTLSLEGVIFRFFVT